MIKLDKKIKIPQKGLGKYGKYPFSSMSVGDSFEVTAAKRNSVEGAARGWAKRNDPTVKFSIRTTDKTVRIWRIK